MRSSNPWLLVAGALLLGATAAAHDDMVGTRYVAPSGADAGDCDDNHDPCRTLLYALTQVNPGDAIKLAAGTYDVSGIDVEDLLLGKEGVRGGYSAEDHFQIQSAETNRTRVTGVPDALRNNFIAHGFTVVDWNGNVLPRIERAKLTAPTACTAGFVGAYPCHNVDFLGQVQLTDIPGTPTSMSNLWGFVDADDNREYAVVGHRNGTVVYDVTNPGAPALVGNIPGNESLWREVKVLQVADPNGGRHRAYAYISTEAPASGMQIIDLTDLPARISLANTFMDFNTSHTLYISNVDYATMKALPGQKPFLYIAGSNLTSGAFRIYSLDDPVHPVVVTGPPSGTSYMHDSSSMLITDSRTTQCSAGHNPCEVLIDFHVGAVVLWDVTDKSLPVLISSTGYPTASYTHSGWPTPDNRYIIVHDELDELRRGLNTQIYTLDIANLQAPVMNTSYVGAVTSTDHNGYAVGNRYYVSHYKRGLVIFDSTNPRALTEIGSFDTYLLPQQNTAGTDGAWGVYPFLPSGTLLVSDIVSGLYLLKRNETLPPPTGGGTTPPTTPPSGSSSGGGGGGGTFDLLALILLSGFAMVRARKIRA